MGSYDNYFKLSDKLVHLLELPHICKVIRSPERVDTKKYAYSSDIWSFGLIIFELVNGFNPYFSNTYFETLNKIVKLDPP